MASDFTDVTLFEGKSLSDLFKEIYDNSKAKKEQIKELIADLAPLIEGIGDATILVPLIKEYLEVGVKNDEQLVKLAQIVQRYSSNVGKKDDSDIWAEFSSLMDSDKDNKNQLDQINSDAGNSTEKPQS